MTASASHLSFQIPEVLNELCASRDYNAALQLVTDCFERWPKEEDSITRIVLEGLKEAAEEEHDERSVIFFSYLLKHLEILYNEWMRT